MKNLRKHAETTSETVRDLVSQLIIKHELAALEIMCELKAENVILRAAARQARTALSDLIASGDPKVYSDALNALDEALRDCGHESCDCRGYCKKHGIGGKE